MSEPDTITRDIGENTNLLLSADSAESPILSIVLPTMNEEVGVVECITKIKESLAELGITGEIIVSDSSKDRTAEIAADMGAIVVKPETLGYGYAYQRAFKEVRGEYVVIGDADTTYDFGELPRLLDPIINDEADIVLGSRLAGNIKPGAMPFLHRVIGNPLLTNILNILYEADVSDAHSGFRIITRDALEELESSSAGMEYASEMLMEASEKGLSIAEVPITYYPRQGEATLETFQDGWRHIRFMLVNVPGYLFHVPGVFFGMLGVVLMTVALFNIRIGGQPFGIHSMVAGSLLTILGQQVIYFGLLTLIEGNPIRQSQDKVTQWFLNEFSLERGVALGVVLFAAGTVLSGYLVFQWIESGFTQLPDLFLDIAAFTALILGIQTVFNSFFASIIENDAV